ncbi:hypothetical protein [Pedosphaera parvula]|uniref:Uncharacterized protein n=1 Tax=Pedosphaera parvula (strain Ellin514) TaxID=320771 RepID=B9XP62_PEDPL|nr:hypothetical protein [Pedosphaera parvula]EEF58418.1 hypothetical protein Cflav_PD6161 [Pedosphaera parvula Ellin514]
MKTPFILFLILLLLTPAIRSQPSQTQTLPAVSGATPANSSVNTTNSGLIGSDQDFVSTNGIFIGNIDLILQALQNDIDRARQLLAQIQSLTVATNTPGPTTAVVGTFVAGNDQTPNQLTHNFGIDVSQDLSQNFSSSAAVPAAGVLATPPLTYPSDQLIVQTGPPTGPNAPVLPSIPPYQILAPAAVEISPGIFAAARGTTSTDNVQPAQSKLALLNSLQAALQDLQTDAQAILPDIPNAIGSVGNQSGTDSGFGSPTNTFGSRFTNSSGTIPQSPSSSGTSPR